MLIYQGYQAAAYEPWAIQKPRSRICRRNSSADAKQGSNIDKLNDADACGAGKFFPGNERSSSDEEPENKHQGGGEMVILFRRGINVRRRSLELQAKHTSARPN